MNPNIIENHKLTISTTNHTINNVDDKKLLDIYYYIDYDDTKYDTAIIERCLKLNIQVNERSYTINKFINCKRDNLVVKNDDGDIIKRGLLTFNKMFKRLKLKGNVDVWFVYISNGNVKMYKDVFIGLLNKNPCIKTSSYIINKSNIYISSTDKRDDKLDKLKRLNSLLKDLVTDTQQDNTITYTNLIE
jgi:hypothetical protein